MKATSAKPRWTAAQIEQLTKRYPHERTADIAADLGLKIAAVYNKAHSLGLHKSEDFLKSPAAGRMNYLKGAATRFKKGQISWNKGLKGLQIGGVATQFKKGHLPKNHKPIGSTRTDDDGYVWIKTAEPNKYEMLHRVNWRKAHGALPPKGMALIFKDGNRQNCDVSNLELLSRQELMARNSLHNLPKELVQVMQLRGALNRKINRRLQNEQH